MIKKVANIFLVVLTILVLLVPCYINSIMGQHMMLYRFLIVKQYEVIGKTFYQLIILFPLLAFSLNCLVKKRCGNKIGFISIIINILLLIIMIVLSLIGSENIVIYFPLCLSLYIAIALTYALYILNKNMSTT